MATFLGVLPNTQIAVDTFRLNASRQPPRVFFLTHVHTDHVYGLSDSFQAGPIYCSEITRELVLLKFPRLDPRLLRPLELGQAHCIPINAAENVYVTATLYDANHCAGSVMLLLDGYFGRYLHTGDMRYDAALHHAILPDLVARPVDRLFLDTTFCNRFWRFPTKAAATRQVVDLIERHARSAVVYLEAEMLGLEDLLEEVSTRLGCKIAMDEEKARMMCSIPKYVKVVTTIESTTRIKLCKHRTLSSFSLASAQSNQPMPPGLYIKPSCLWYRSQKGHLADLSCFVDNPTQENGIWHVLFALHSSYEELLEFVRYVRPRELIPIVDVPRSDLEAFDELLDPTPPTAATLPQALHLEFTLKRAASASDGATASLDSAAILAAAAAAEEASAADGDGLLAYLRPSTDEKKRSLALSLSGSDIEDNDDDAATRRGGIGVAESQTSAAGRRGGDESSDGRQGDEQRGSGGGRELSGGSDGGSHSQSQSDVAALFALDLSPEERPRGARPLLVSRRQRKRQQLMDGGDVERPE